MLPGGGGIDSGICALPTAGDGIGMLPPPQGIGVGHCTGPEDGLGTNGPGVGKVLSRLGGEGMMGDDDSDESGLTVILLVPGGINGPCSDGGAGKGLGICIDIGEFGGTTNVPRRCKTSGVR